MIANDPSAAADYRSLEKRTRKIFALPLLEFGRTLGDIALFTGTRRQLAATPLDFLPDADDFSPKGAGPSGTFTVAGLGFEVKGQVPLARARAGLCRIQALGLVFMVSGDLAFAERARQELRAMCRLARFSWSTSFLARATFMQAVALGYDWFHDELSEDDRRIIRRVLLKHGIEAALGEFDKTPQENWITKPNNWNIVCNASIAMAALALADKEPDPRVLRAFDEAIASVRQGFSHFAPEGSWKQEGPGYWHLAVEHAVYLLDSLDTALGTDLGLAEMPGFADTGLYRLYMGGTSSKLFNYGDSEESRRGLWWMHWLGHRFRRPIYVAMARDRSPTGAAAEEIHPMDLLWGRTEQVPPKIIAPLGKVFAEAAALRGPWEDPSATYLGLKGGATFDGRYHSHLDLGSFVLDALGQRWAIDIGPPKSYSECYLAPPERYQFYRASTFGHNTLVVNGGNQRCPATARFGRLRLSADLAAISLDMTSAYSECRSLVRTVGVADGRHVTIVDDISPRSELDSVVWQMHTTAEISLAGNHAVLTLKDEAGSVYHLFAWMTAPLDALFTVETAEQPPPIPATGRDCTGPDPAPNVRKLVARFRGIAKPTRLAVVLSPDSRLPSPLHLPPRR
jgi:hypothetical protein